MISTLRPFSNWIAAALLAFTTLAGLIVAPASQAGPPKKSRSSRSKVLSAKEAREAAARKVALRRKMSGLYGKMRNVRARMRKAEVKAHHIGESIHTVEGRIGATRRRIARVQSRLRTLDQRHDATVERLRLTEERLRKRQEMLGGRLRDNYQRGTTTYAHILLQSASVQQVLSRHHYVKRIVKSDTELIQGVRQDIRQIEADKRALERQAAEQRELGVQFEAEKARLATDLSRRRVLLQDVREERQEAAEELDDLESESEAMASRIRLLSELLERRRRAQIAAAREAAQRRKAERLARERAARRHNRPAPRQEPEEEEPAAPDMAPVWRGGFRRPVSARITSGFGYRYHPILHRRRLHSGVDFGAPSGTSIHAAGDGTVILAGYSGGYGNCVIIDHGNGTTTLYGHCSAVMVSEGQVVRVGQVIARVGSTGLSTGPHLHWEVRRNGVPVNPR